MSTNLHIRENKNINYRKKAILYCHHLSISILSSIYLTSCLCMYSSIYLSPYRFVDNVYSLQSRIINLVFSINSLQLFFSSSGLDGLCLCTALLTIQGKIAEFGNLISFEIRLPIMLHIEVCVSASEFSHISILLVCLTTHLINVPVATCPLRQLGDVEVEYRVLTSIRALV